MKKPLRLAIAQMNPSVGDFPANAKKIIRWIEQAENQNSDFIVFPECALSGYPVWDLANKKQFVEEGLRWLRKITASTKGKKVTAVLGYIERSKPRSRNNLAWIENGKLLHRYTKRLLPTYDVFLEDIFFEPGLESRVIQWKGQKVGPTICEDIWDFQYNKKPVEELARQKADWILNISASPFYAGVAARRDQLLKDHARRSRLPMLYVNQVGAQDDLIFDGRSLMMDGQGRILFRAPAFEEGLFSYEWNPASKGAQEIPPLDISKEEEVYQALVLGIRDYCRKNGFSKAVIGLSGGIDSALVAVLAADALGPEMVCGVAMPGPYSSSGSWEDAEDLAERLGIEFRVYPIREKYEFLTKAYRDQRGEAESDKIKCAHENLQSRLRGLELMFISNDENRLLLSTGNKSELAMGYCTLYGDMAGGLCVLGDVYKTDVYALAHWRNKQKAVIPKPTLTKAPSAELRPNQKDQDSLPPYEILDAILCLYIEGNKSADEIVRLMRKKKVSAETVTDVIRRVDHNEYKRRQTPPILRVTEKAWFGRRMPITNCFEI